MKTDDSIHKQKDFLTTAEKDTPLVPAETFAKLYQKNYLSVYRYIYAFTGGSVEQAEDLTAETFMRAWKNRTAFHGKTSSAVGWIIRIAHNLVVDSYRHEKTGPDIRPDPLDEELDLPTAASLSPEGQVDGSGTAANYPFVVGGIAAGPARNPGSAVFVELENPTDCSISGFSREHSICVYPTGA